MAFGRSRWALIALAGAVALAIVILWPLNILSGTSDAEPEPSPTLGAFAGASPARIFLTAPESAEAARRGLMPPGTRSVIRTDGRLSHGSWRWDETGVPPGPIVIRADLTRQLVSAFRGPHEIGTAVIVYGVQGKDTPSGRLPIRGKTRDYHSITYDAPMPYSLWLREDGVALHGSSVRMGKATNGCIGVPVDFAEKLFAVARKGDIVEVVGAS